MIAKSFLVIAQATPREKDDRKSPPAAGKCDQAHGLEATPCLELRMAGPSRTATPAAPSSAPAEHIFIASEDQSSNPAVSARSVRETATLRNPVRRVGAELVLYDEGFLKVIELHKGAANEPFFLDLRFVDPIPKIERIVAVRWLTAALGCAALAALAGFLLRFEAFDAVAMWALGASALATAVTLYVGIYSSHETIEFCTLHGRVSVLRLIANFGSMAKYRAFVPVLSRAIEEAAERIGTDTSAYLRAEMREHYRLRGDGVLDNDECAAGTGRILAQFDVQL